MNRLIIVQNSLNCASYSFCYHNYSSFLLFVETILLNTYHQQICTLTLVILYIVNRSEKTEPFLHRESMKVIVKIRSYVS